MIKEPDRTPHTKHRLTRTPRQLMSNTFSSITQHAYNAAIGIVVAIATSFLYSAIDTSPVNKEELYLSLCLLLLSAFLYLLERYFLKLFREKSISEKTLQLRVSQQAIINVLGASIEQDTGIRVNVRLYNHKKVSGEDRLYQNKEIHRLRVMRSTEDPFTYISIDEKNMVMCEAFKARHHIVRSLSDLSAADYSTRANKAVDPEQKWIIALPLTEMSSDATIDEQSNPTGILAIYSNENLDLNDTELMDNIVYNSQQSTRAISAVQAMYNQSI